MRAKFQNFY